MELLANWINNELELSKHVENFEKDFSNGYLFGELLKRYNQQEDLESFSKKDNRDSKINNFTLLEPTFRSLKVKFNTKLIDNIMKEKRGAALGLLCQLKMALEKVYQPTDISVQNKTGKASDNKPSKKLNPGKELYDERAHTFFQRRLQEMNRSQKGINLEDHLQKFEEIRMKQEEQARKGDCEEEEMNVKMKQDMRKAQIDKLQRNAGFMEEWLRKGIEDWKRNQTIKKEREKKTLEFELKQTKKIENTTMRQISHAVSEVYDGIGDFENNLKKQGIDPELPGSNVSSPVKTRITTTQSANKFSKVTGGLNISATIGADTSGVTKDRGNRMSEDTRKERQRRRGKLIKTLNNDILKDLENQTREDQYVDRLKRQAKQEKELAYEIWRTQQCKNVIIENRKLREARYFKRKELDTNNAYAREEEMLRTLDEQRNIDEESQQERDEILRINNAQFRRQTCYEGCLNMFNEIFEIANQAYILLQKSDSEEIDPRSWREWMNLFKNEKSIKETFTEGKADPDHDDDKVIGKIEIELHEATTVDSDKILDDSELDDYLKNKGQWTNWLVSGDENKFNVADIFAPAEPVGGKGAKAAPIENKLDDKEMAIPDELPKNNLLGDVVEKIICLNYDGEKDIVKPDIPSHVPLRISIVGTAFSGKKTQAHLLAEKYNLIQYHPYELINEAVERADEELEPVDEQAQQPVRQRPSAEPDSQFAEEQKEIVLENMHDTIKVKEEGDNQEVLDIQEDFERHGSNQDSQSGQSKELLDKLRRNAFRAIGRQIREQLLSGQEIDEMLVVDLLIAKIKADFVYKTQTQVDDEIKKVIQREEQIKEELQRFESVKGKTFKNSKPVDEAGLRQELDDLSKFSKFGWILVDFPNSIDQAHNLESKLSGFLPDIDREICERNRKLESACRIIEPSEKPNIPTHLIESGLDAVLWLDTQRQECRRRALGRRVDIVNDTEYHIDDNPPPTTNPPLCERLMPVIEPERAEEVIPDKHLAFDLQKDKLIKWFDRFGYEDTNDENLKLSLCHFIDGNSTNSDEITENIKILETIVSRKQHEWVDKREKFRTQILEEKERLRQEEEARLKAEEERKRKEEEEARRAAERAARGEGEGDEPPPQEEVKEETKVEEPAHEEEKAVKENLSPSKDNIDNDFAPVLMNIWDRIEELYVKRMKKSLNQYRNQRDRVITGLFKTQKYFVQYLNRPDFKQAKLDKYVFDFNKFSDEYPDLREDTQTKEELHQRTDTLSDQLWEISEQRKNESVSERKKIMENGWIEFELEQITSMSQNLMQTEIDKFRNSVYLIYDYYYAIEERLINDPPESLHYDLMTYTDEGGSEELPPVFVKEGEGQESKENYPRLNKLFEKALKSQILPEFECTPPGGGAGGDKKAPPKGKDPKKGPAEDEKQEKFYYDQELKDSIATEKAVLRYRLTMIRNWALNLMKEIRSKSIKCFDKLATWIDVAFKAETDAILELEKVIKKSIEKEEKLQFELRIKGMDFHFDEKFLNFQDPPPEIFPAREEPNPNRFTIKQLESLINELIISSENGFIKNEYFIDLMMSKTKNAKSFDDNNGVPSVLKRLTKSDYEMIVKSYDLILSGSISLKKVAITMCLISSSIPDDSQLKEYKENLLKNKVELGNGRFGVKKYDFMNTKAWFDQNEISKDRSQSYPYPRVKNLKSIIFDSVKNENGVLDIDEYLSLLTIKVPGKEIKKYSNVLNL